MGTVLFLFLVSVIVPRIFRGCKEIFSSKRCHLRFLLHTLNGVTESTHFPLLGAWSVFRRACALFSAAAAQPGSHARYGDLSGSGLLGWRRRMRQAPPSSPRTFPRSHARCPLV